MTENSSSEIKLLRQLKPKLITILSSQADFVLQHADSRNLVTPQGYRQIKTCRVPDEKVRDLLDHIIDRGPKAAQGLLELLKDQELQETFPVLHFIKSIQVDSLSPEDIKPRKKRLIKRKCKLESDAVVPKKKNNTRNVVTERQLMTVARAMGRDWKQIAILALDIPLVKLEQIVADNPLHIVDQVFATLRYWRNFNGNKASAAHLHSLLSQPEHALSPGALDFLLE